jgi:hypothetical protein
MRNQNRQTIRSWWGGIGFQSGERIHSTCYEVSLWDGTRWIPLVWRFWLRVS